MRLQHDERYNAPIATAVASTTTWTPLHALVGCGRTSPNRLVALLGGPTGPTR